MKNEIELFISEFRFFETNTKLGVGIRKGLGKMIYVEDILNDKMIYRGKDLVEAVTIYLNFKR
jgi:hypothetical protein